MSVKRIVAPGRGVGPLELGATRAELWSQTDSDVRAYVSSYFDPGERSDSFSALGITAHYRDGRAAEIQVFPRVGPPGRLVPIYIEDEDVAEFTRADIAAFCDLRGWRRDEGLEFTRVFELGLTFWYRHDFEEPERLEFVRVERPTASADADRLLEGIER